MFPRILLVFIATVFCNDAEAAPAVAVAKPRQFLPPIPGYIPVYIRAGDTPLEDINLDLAEAFRSYAQKRARLNSVRARSQNILTDDEKKKSTEDLDKLETKKAPANNKDDSSLGLDHFNLDDNRNRDDSTEKYSKQHVQKIKPRT